MRILHGPTGKLIRGHVLDANERAFSEALKFYDPQLYVRWNPKKMRNWGCWEIRRRPNKKTAVYQGSHEGVAYLKVMPIEFDAVHHVLDCAFLNYDAIRKIKEMDMFIQIDKSGFKSLEDVLAGREEIHRARLRETARAELKYALKQNRTAAREFYEAVRSGIHPAQVLLSTNWAQK